LKYNNSYKVIIDKGIMKTSGIISIVLGTACTLMATREFFAYAEQKKRKEETPIVEQVGQSKPRKKNHLGNGIWYSCSALADFSAMYISSRKRKKEARLERQFAEQGLCDIFGCPVRTNCSTYRTYNHSRN
jgi:hypothetical protein